MTFCWIALSLLVVAHNSLAATNVTLVPPNDALTFSSGWKSASNAAGQQFFLVDDLGTVLSAALPGSSPNLFR